MVIYPQDLCLFQEANGYLPRLNLHSQVFFPETPHILRTLFLSSLPDVGSIYGDTLWQFLFRKANQKDVKKNVYFPNNPRRHAPLSPHTSCVVKSGSPLSAHTCHLHSCVCVCVYVEGCVTGKLGASIVEGIFNSLLTLITILRLKKSMLTVVAGTANCPFFSWNSNY